MGIAAEINAKADSMIVWESLRGAMKKLKVTIDDGARIVGCSSASLKKGSDSLFDPSNKTGELSLQFIRLFRSMYALAGGDEAFMIHLFNTKNTLLGKAPKEAVETIEGLIAFNSYYDAMRGKV